MTSRSAPPLDIGWEIKAATDQLCELTKRWTIHEDIPRSQQIECRDIGRKLHAHGGEAAMRDAYYEAIGRNRAASVLETQNDLLILERMPPDQG